MSEPTPPVDPPFDDAPTRAGATNGDDLLAELADDLLRRHRAGERPSLDDYAAKHPELAGRIRELFPAMMAMEQPGIGAALELAPPAERVGVTVGRYKLLERIGEGGFGVVYMAEQLTPVRRKVALKVIKPGLDTRQVIARFEAERQALALMDHENIAKVLDAGATDSGRPYFVMELVHGVPLTDYCDGAQLAPRERLELFVQVCRAVQHAHTKGIIHRDIKPTNVLVTLHEGVAVPKVIDFGVAKATGQQLTDKTLFTHFAQMVGTPLYMSPEQAEMTGVDVDTRSDVYSLGVLLYELLTGTTPLDKERLKRAAFDEVRRIIREEEPPRPSTRLSTMGEQARRSVSAQRSSDPRRLGQLFRRELDWIVMRALEKERSRRYETANGLARDVERYLRDDPVEACPPSAAYRLRKFALRNRRALATAALAGALLLAAAVAVLFYAAEQRQLAKQQKALYDDRDRFAAEQGESLRRLEGIQRETQADLYQALLRQSAALREGRQPGYRAQVWANLRRAAALPARNPDDIRREVLACLGDPIGLEPVGATSARRAASQPIPEHFRPMIPMSLHSRTAVAPGGKLVAVYTRDIVLGGEGGKVLATVDPPLGFIYDLTFTADGRLLIAGCEEGVAVWTVPDLRPFTFYRGHNAHSVAAQPGGPLIASTGSGITLWSLRSNRPVAALNMPPAVKRVEFSADGKFLLAVAGDQVLAAWHVGHTPEKIELAGHDGAVPTVAFSPDGTLLASAGKDRKVKFWDARSGNLRHAGEGHEAAVESVAFSPDGTVLASGDNQGVIRFWDPATGRSAGRVNAVCGQVWRLQFDPGGRYLAAAGNKGVAAWAIRQGPGAVTAEEFLALPLTAGAYDLAIHPAGTGLAWLEVSRGLSAYDLPHARPRSLPVRPQQQLRILHFDPSGERLRFATADGRLGAVGWPEGQPASVPSPMVRFSAPSPDGRWLATMDPALRGLVVFDLESGREWAALPPQAAETWALSWSPDGTRLAAGLTDGGVVVWNLGQVRARLAEFEIVVPSTAARPVVPRPPPLAAADFEEIVKVNREANPARRDELAVAALDSLIPALRAQGREDEARAAELRRLGIQINIAGDAIRQEQANPGLYRRRADLLCRAGRFREAVADFDKAIELEPDNHSHYFFGAPVYLHSGDVEGYRRVCRQMVQRFAKAEAPDVGERVAKASLIEPDPEADLELLAGLVGRAVALGDSHPYVAWFKITEALSEYRRGRYERAIEVVKSVPENRRMDDYSRGLAGLVVGMSHAKAGRSDQARQALAEAAAKVEALGATPGKRDLGFDGTDPGNWCTYQIVLAQARAVVNGPPAQTRQQTSK